MVFTQCLSFLTVIHFSSPHHSSVRHIVHTCTHNFSYSFTYIFSQFLPQFHTQLLIILCSPDPGRAVPHASSTKVSPGCSQLPIHQQSPQSHSVTHSHAPQHSSYTVSYTQYFSRPQNSLTEVPHFCHTITQTSSHSSLHKTSQFLTRFFKFHTRVPCRSFHSH